jgi:hypothetical protein
MTDSRLLGAIVRYFPHTMKRRLCHLLAAGVCCLFPVGLARAGVSQKAVGSAAEGVSAIAVDAHGRTHVSWQSPDNRLHYALIDHGRKAEQVVDPVGDCGGFSSIAVDSAGRPHIAYNAFRAGVGYVLAYAHFDGAAWHIEDISTSGVGTAIAIDANDEPHIVQAAEEWVGNQFVAPFEYLHHDDSGWHSERPAGITGNGRWPMSLVLDSAGHAHVMLQGRVIPGPGYATNMSGDWVLTSLGTDSMLIGSLALDSQERPHVVLEDYVVNTVRHLFFDGVIWQSENLYDPSDFPAGITNAPQAAALAIGPHDHPAVLFHDQLYRGGDAADVVVYAYHDGVGWRALLVFPHAADHWVRLALAPDGTTQGLYGRSRGFDRNQLRTVRVTLPDLAGEWVSLGVMESGGQSRITGVLSVRNDGSASSQGVPIALYLSSDAALDAGDSLLAVPRSVGGVAPGATRTVKVSFTRAGSVAGQYLIAVLDPQARREDLDRPSNTIAGVIGK